MDSNMLQAKNPIRWTGERPVQEFARLRSPLEADPGPSPVQRSHGSSLRRGSRSVCRSARRMWLNLNPPARGAPKRRGGGIGGTVRDQASPGLVDRLGYVAAKVLGYPVLVRRTLSIEVGMQDSGLGTVLARHHFTDPMTALPCTISATIHTVLGSALAAIWRLRDRRKRTLRAIHYRSSQLFLAIQNLLNLGEKPTIDLCQAKDLFQ